jgi:hypothetical protein
MATDETVPTQRVCQEEMRLLDLPRLQEDAHRLKCPGFCPGLRLQSLTAWRMLPVAEQTAPVLSPHMAACI